MTSMVTIKAITMEVSKKEQVITKMDTIKTIMMVANKRKQVMVARTIIEEGQIAETEPQRVEKTE